MLKLDYSIQSPQKRNELVKKILQENPNANLDNLADYLIFCMDRQERRKKHITTENRSITINKRETSFEGLAANFEGGEDQIYGLITNDKNTIFKPKISITKKDLDEIPFLRQVKEAIDTWEIKLLHATGRAAYIIKRTIIDLRKDQYIIKNAYRKPIVMNKLTHSESFIPLEGEVYYNPSTGKITTTGITLLSLKVCQSILRFYSKLKAQCYDQFESDLYYLMMDFDRISKKALADHPILDYVATSKIDGKSNKQIHEDLEKKFNLSYSPEYISTLWRRKIPSLLVQTAEKEFLEDYYLNQARGHYKRCSHCGQYKLALPQYFTRNKTSLDGFYSTCKECRHNRVKKI